MAAAMHEAAVAAADHQPAFDTVKMRFNLGACGCGACGHAMPTGRFVPPVLLEAQPTNTKPAVAFGRSYVGISKTSELRPAWTCKWTLRLITGYLDGVRHETPLDN